LQEGEFVMTRSLLLAVLAAGLAILSAGEVSADDRLCPMLYRPVCAMTADGHHRTFDNSCLALKANAIIRHQGVCRRRHR
jgi:hypothetical protein